MRLSKNYTKIQEEDLLKGELKQTDLTPYQKFFL